MPPAMETENSNWFGFLFFKIFSQRKKSTRELTWVYLSHTHVQTDVQFVWYIKYSTTYSSFDLILQ